MANDGSILTVVKWLGITLLLPLVISAQSITGKIVDPIPLPLPGVPVGLLTVGGEWVTKSTQTDSNGTFKFIGVEPGEYVLTARTGGFQSRVLRVRALSGKDVDAGALELRVSGCDSPGVNCDTFGPIPPRRPPVLVVDLCEALRSPGRYGNQLIVVVATLTNLHGSPTLTARCSNVLSSGGLTWTNSVLLPEGAAPPELADAP